MTQPNPSGDRSNIPLTPIAVVAAVIALAGAAMITTALVHRSQFSADTRVEAEGEVAANPTPPPAPWVAPGLSVQGPLPRPRVVIAGAPQAPLFPPPHAVLVVRTTPQPLTIPTISISVEPRPVPAPKAANPPLIETTSGVPAAISPVAAPRNAEAIESKLAPPPSTPAASTPAAAAPPERADSGQRDEPARADLDSQFRDAEDLFARGRKAEAGRALHAFIAAAETQPDQQDHVVRAREHLRRLLGLQFD